MVNKRLEDKANSSGVVVIPLNHTLQTCSTPKHHARENHKSQAVTKCVACGYEADADINKAQNILTAGLVVTGSGKTPQALGYSGPAKLRPSKEEVA